MFTHRYNGAYINGYCAKPECYVTTDCGRFHGVRFKTYRAAQIAITRARKAGMPASR
jgi:hypothetical protein